jgi:hypothetical protein
LREQAENLKSSVGAKVDHRFRAIKRRFRQVKVR